MNYIGIDVGGTNLKAGLVSESGELLATTKMKIASISNQEMLVRTMVDMTRELAEKVSIPLSEIASVGVGVPGAVEIRSGMLLYTCNLPLRNVPLRRLFHKHLRMPLYIENDANCAALGEYYVGAGRDSKRFVMVTLGTGVGGGVIVNGKIVSGAFGAGGEIGHLPVCPEETETCGCGKKGCLEQYASATGIVRLAGKKLQETDVPSCLRQVETLTARDVLDAAKAGDALAKELLEEVCEILGRALAGVACVADPEAFIIGGGVSKAGPILTETISKYYKKYAFHASREAVFRLASLGNDAGMYGAVQLVLE